MTSRHWVFTLNNYTTDDIETCKDFDCRYGVFGLEVGKKKGIPHIQGYMEFNSAVRFAKIKKVFPRAYIKEKYRRSTREQAANYCKKDGNFFEIGEFTRGGQGARNDLKEVIKMIKEEVPEKTIMEEMPEVVARNMRFFERYLALHEKDTTREFRKVNVEVRWGAAGTGKTRYAHEKFPEIFTVNCDDNFPFNGYSGEKAILLDDFYGNMKHHFLLRVLDGHQLRVDIKGGARYAQWTDIIITSNKPPQEWYEFGLKPELARRLTHIVEISSDTTSGDTKCAGNIQPHTDYIDELIELLS